jgi:hypothetical protein
MHLEAAEQALAQDRSRRAQHSIKHGKRHATDDARRSWGLRPESLERDPLPKAIMRVAERWAEEHHLLGAYHITGTLPRCRHGIEVTRCARHGS